MDPEKTLSWEKRHRPRAAIAALIGAIGLLVFYVASERLQSEAARASAGWTRSSASASPARWATLPSLRLTEFQYLHDNQLLVLGIGLGAFIGFIGMAWAVGFLGVATRARTPEFRRFLIYVPIIGGVVARASAIMLIQIAVVVLTNDFLDGPRRSPTRRARRPGCSSSARSSTASARCCSRSAS